MSKHVGKHWTQCVAPQRKSYWDGLNFCECIEIVNIFTFQFVFIIYISAFVVHLSCQITMLHWIPDPDKMFVLYILAALWGIGDAVIQTQINGRFLSFVSSRKKNYRRPKKNISLTLAMLESKKWLAYASSIESGTYVQIHMALYC